MTAVRTTPVTDHDRRRLSVTWRTLGGGVATGVLGAVALALLGFDGRVGFATVMLGSALGSVAGGLVTAVLAVVDESRRAPVATRRVGVTLGLFVLGAVLLISVFALAGVDGPPPGELSSTPPTDAVAS